MRRPRTACTLLAALVLFLASPNPSQRSSTAPFPPCGLIVDIMTIGVTTSARRRGLARQALRLLLVDLARRGVRRVTLDVKADNAAALAFYRQHGFFVTAFRDAFYAINNKYVPPGWRTH